MWSDMSGGDSPVPEAREVGKFPAQVNRDTALAASLEVGRVFRQFPKETRRQVEVLLRDRALAYARDPDAMFTAVMLLAVVASTENTTGDEDGFIANMLAELNRLK